MADAIPLAAQIIEAARDLIKSLCNMLHDVAPDEGEARAEVEELIGEANELLDGGREIYEAPRTVPEIRVRGVSRDLFEPRSVSIALSERPTDDEICLIHDFLRERMP